MLVSENGKLIELPEDIRAMDKYKIYENTLVVNYAEKKMYSFYVQQATGLKKEAEGLKVEPRFFESGFILIELPGENVLYNTKTGEIVAAGNIIIGQNSNPDVCIGNSFKAVVLEFYENGIDTYRVFDDRGNEILDSKYVGNGKKVELLDYNGLGNIMPIKIRDDRFVSRHCGVLHILFWEDGTSEVIEVIPIEYERVFLNRRIAVKDCYEKIHYPTYEVYKDDKTFYFTFNGKIIRLPKK